MARKQSGERPPGISYQGSQSKVELEWFYNGLKCAVVRHLCLCGYVRVGKDHPDYQKYYDAVDVDVHGGLTFCQLAPDGFWFGFDTAHYGDRLVLPVMGIVLPFNEGIEWTVEAVKAETERLADQLIKRGNP